MSFLSPPPYDTDSSSTSSTSAVVGYSLFVPRFASSAVGDLVVPLLPALSLSQTSYSAHERVNSTITSLYESYEHHASGFKKQIFLLNENNDNDDNDGRIYLAGPVNTVHISLTGHDQGWGTSLSEVYIELLRISIHRSDVYRNTPPPSSSSASSSSSSQFRRSSGSSSSSSSVVVVCSDSIFSGCLPHTATTVNRAYSVSHPLVSSTHDHDSGDSVKRQYAYRITHKVGRGASLDETHTVAIEHFVLNVSLHQEQQQQQQQQQQAPNDNSLQLQQPGEYAGYVDIPSQKQSACCCTIA